jgi:hypothetical protein
MKVKRNKLYIYEFFCEKEMKDVNEIVLSLEDETKPDFLYDSVNSFLYDVIDVLKDKKIIGVMVDDLYEIGETKNV